MLTPEAIMLKSINKQLVELFGSGATRALNYRVDPKVALLDPLGYEEDMRQVFGPISAKIIQSLRDCLCQEAGKSPTAACKSIDGCLKCLEQHEWRTPIPHIPARTLLPLDAMVQFRYPLT